MMVMMTTTTMAMTWLTLVNSEGMARMIFKVMTSTIMGRPTKGDDSINLGDDYFNDSHKICYEGTTIKCGDN